MMAPREWPVALVWALLASASVLGFTVVEGGVSARAAATTAVILAAIKIHLVFGHYMELRWHHRPLRAMLATWLAVVTATLLTGIWAA